MSSQTPVLRLEGIVKTFPGVRALDGVSFSVMPGEVHALMGENGAGKSTSMKVLGGLYQPDEGTIYVDEVPTIMSSPLDAKAKGIVFIPPRAEFGRRAFGGRKRLSGRTAEEAVRTGRLGHALCADRRDPR